MILVPVIDKGIGKGHLRSRDVINCVIFSNKSRHDGAKDLWVVPNCSPGQGASFGMKHDHTPQPHRWMTWPLLRVTFRIGLWMSSHAYFAASTRVTKMYWFYVSMLLSLKVIKVNNSKTFYRWWPLKTSLLTWPENVLCKSCRDFNGLSNTVCRLSLQCLFF